MHFLYVKFCGMATNETKHHQVKATSGHPTLYTPCDTQHVLRQNKQHDRIESHRNDVMSIHCTSLRFNDLRCWQMEGHVLVTFTLPPHMHIVKSSVFHVTSLVFPFHTIPQEIWYTKSYGVNQWSIPCTNKHRHSAPQHIVNFRWLTQPQQQPYILVSYLSMFCIIWNLHAPPILR